MTNKTRDEVALVLRNTCIDDIETWTEDNILALAQAVDAYYHKNVIAELVGALKSAYEEMEYEGLDCTNIEQTLANYHKKTGGE